MHSPYCTALESDSRLDSRPVSRPNSRPNLDRCVDRSQTSDWPVTGQFVVLKGKFLDFQCSIEGGFRIPNVNSVSPTIEHWRVIPDCIPDWIPDRFLDRILDRT